MKKLTIKKLYQKIKNKQDFAVRGGCPPSQITNHSCYSCPLYFPTGKYSFCFFIDYNLGHKQTSSKEDYLKFLVKKFPNLILE